MLAPGVRAASRTETLTFRLALAAGALWVLDDAFWHREPGTAPSDHLASGLVPLALAALLAFVYPRLRPGPARDRCPHGGAADDRRRASSTASATSPSTD